jgi:hypothetical protein
MLDDIDRQQAYLGTLVSDPGRNRIAVLSTRAPRIEIFSAAGGVLMETEGPYPFVPDYRFDRRGEFMAGPRNRHAYPSASATDGQILALFSGRAEAHFRGWSGSHGEFLHVFDWDGEFQRAFRLDREVLRIAVDPAGGRLYALTDHPEPAVVVFSLGRGASSRRAGEIWGCAVRGA